MAARLLLPVPVGMANNGDAVRLMCQIGANADSPPRATARVLFVRFWYPFLRTGSGPPCLHYPTTQVVQVWLTAWVHQHVLGLSGAIDMRELIVEYCVLAGVVMMVAARLLAELRPAARILILILLFLVLSEAAFADYAASPFTETAALYGMLVFAVAGVAVAARARGYHAAYLVAWASALLAVGAKTEATTLALPLGLFLGAQRFPAGGGRGWSACPPIPGLCVLTLAVTVFWSLSREPRSDVRVNSADELTMTIMPMVSDLGAAAAGLGLPRAFGRYSGTLWWSAHPIEDDPAYPRYADRFTQANLAHYLIGRPGLTARIFASGACLVPDLPEHQPGQLPGLAWVTLRAVRNAGTACSRTSRGRCGGPGWPGSWRTGWPAWPGAGLLLRRSRRGDRRRGFALVALVLIGCTVIQYVTAVYGEGNEVIKHMVIALFTASIAPIWLLAGVLCTSPRAGPSPGSRGADAGRERSPARHLTDGDLCCARRHDQRTRPRLQCAARRLGSHPALVAGPSVDDDDGHDDPVLRWPDGRTVDTWREDYPYAERMPRQEYEYQKRPLQIELLKLQTGSRPPASAS